MASAVYIHKVGLLCYIVINIIDLAYNPSYQNFILLFGHIINNICTKLLYFAQFGLLNFF